MPTNWYKIIGLISVLLGIAAVAYPMPDLWKVYVLGTETLINGALNFWAGTPAGATAGNPTPAAK